MTYPALLTLDDGRTFPVELSDPGCPPQPVVPVASAGPETGGVTGQGGAS